MRDFQIRRILCLVPPDPEARRLCRHGFLHDELWEFARRGIEIHTASPLVRRKTRLHDSCVIHPLPTLRASLARTSRALWHCLADRRLVPWQGSTVLRLARSAMHQVAIADLARTLAVDVIYSAFAWPYQLAGVLARAHHGVPLVVSLRGGDVRTALDDFDRVNAGSRARLTVTLKTADYVTAISRFLRDETISLGAAPERTVVIPKGVQEDEFTPGDRTAARATLGLPDRPTILFVGHLASQKDPLTLVRAFRDVAARRPQAQLVLCGEGPLRQQIEEYAQAHGLAGSIVFAGYVVHQQIPEFFRACDIFVLPSIREGAGNVLLEAAACERPRIGSRSGGIVDYIEDGVTGLLFEPGDSNDLAAKLQRLLDHVPLAEAMGRQARQTVLERFRYRTMVDSLLALFEQAALRRVPSRNGQYDGVQVAGR